jgi:hypothetical protein
VYMLKGQLDLDKCVPKGLEGDGLPATGKGARLFTFEVSAAKAHVCVAGVYAWALRFT